MKFKLINIFSLLVTTVLGISVANAEGPIYKYKKYIPAVSVVDSPVVNPTDPTPQPQYGSLTFSSTTLSLPRVEDTASTELTVIAANLTDKPVTASNISVTGGFSLSYSCSTGSLPALLNPGQNCAITLTGVGSSVAAKSGTLSIAYQSGGSIAAIVSMPRSLVPSLLETGTSQIVLAGGNGATTEVGTVMLLNSGEQTAEIQSISVQGSGFSASQNCLAASNGALPSNTTCTVTVSGVGTTVQKSASLLITYNNGKTVSIPIIQYNAVNNEGGVLNSSDSTLLFDAKDVGAKDTKTFTITNIADWGTTVKSVSVPQNSNYTTTIACPGGSQLPVVLAKSQNCTVTVETTFQSTAQSTTVSVEYNNTSLGVAVSTPVGLAPSADINTGALNFGYFNTYSNQDNLKTVTLSNNGTKSLDISNVSITGANPTYYSVTNGCGATLLAASSCDISVTAATEFVGDYSATLTIQTAVGNKTVALSSSVQPLSLNSLEMIAGSSSSYLTATTTVAAPSLATVSSVKLYDQADSVLQMNSSTLSWNAGSRTLTANFNSVTPGQGMYVARFLSSTGKILAKGSIVVYNPITLRVLDSNNTSASAIDFGNISTGAQKILRLANLPNAKGNLNISNISVTAGAFSLGAPSNSQGGATCASLTSITLTPGGACDIPVNISNTPGNYSTGYSITVTSNATASTPVSGGASVAIPVKAVLQSVTDPNYSSVIILMDASSGTPTNTATGGSVVNSGVTVATTPSITGAKSMYFNGSSSINVVSNQSLGAGDFTIEGWYYYISDTNGFYMSGISGSPSIRSMQGAIMVFQNDNGGDYRQGPGLTRNGWTHIAYVRASGVVYTYINGVMQSGMTVNNTVNYTANFSAKLGGVNGYAYNVNAYYDQFRVTKGLARYTANFTPPSVPYASQPPANGSILLNLKDTSNNALSSVAFGSGAGSTTKTFRIANDATSVYPLSVTNLDLTAGGPPFSLSNVSNPLGGATCTSTTKMTIPAGGSCDVTVAIGSVAGAYTSGYNVTITSNATNSSPLSGGTSVVLPVTGTVVAAGDPYWGNVSFLGGMDTASFVDSSSQANAMLTSGGATRSTSIVKFGASSIAFDGGSNSYYGMSSANPAAVNFTGVDFTLEYFAYQNAKTAVDACVIGAANGSNNGRSFYMCVNNGNMIFNWYPDGANVNRQFLNFTAGAFTPGVWHHVAVTRQGSTMRIFLDGVLQASTSTNTVVSFPSGSVFQIGKEAAYAGSGFSGYVDEVRVTKGVARYTSNFVVPTAAFPRN